MGKQVSTTKREIDLSNVVAVTGLNVDDVNIPTIKANGHQKTLNIGKMLTIMAMNARDAYAGEKRSDEFLRASGMDPSKGFAPAVYKALAAAYWSDKRPDTGETLASHTARLQYMEAVRKALRVELAARIKGAEGKQVQGYLASLSTTTPVTGKTADWARKAMNAFDAPCSQMKAALIHPDAEKHGILPVNPYKEGEAPRKIGKGELGSEKELVLDTTTNMGKAARLLRERDKDEPTKAPAETSAGQTAATATAEIHAAIDPAATRWDVSQKLANLNTTVAAIMGMVPSGKNGPMFNEMEAQDVHALAKALDAALAKASDLYQRVDARSKTNKHAQASKS